MRCVDEAEAYVSVYTAAGIDGDGDGDEDGAEDEDEEVE